MSSSRDDLRHVGALLEHGEQQHTITRSPSTLKRTWKKQAKMVAAATMAVAPENPEHSYNLAEMFEKTVLSHVVDHSAEKWRAPPPSQLRVKAESKQFRAAPYSGWGVSLDKASAEMYESQQAELRGGHTSALTEDWQKVSWENAYKRKMQLAKHGAHHLHGTAHVTPHHIARSKSARRPNLSIDVTLEGSASTGNLPTPGTSWTAPPRPMTPGAYTPGSSTRASHKDRIVSARVGLTKNLQTKTAEEMRRRGEEMRMAEKRAAERRIGQRQASFEYQNTPSSAAPTAHVTPAGGGGGAGARTQDDDVALGAEVADEWLGLVAKLRYRGNSDERLNRSVKMLQPNALRLSGATGDDAMSLYRTLYVHSVGFQDRVTELISRLTRRREASGEPGEKFRNEMLTAAFVFYSELWQSALGSRFPAYMRALHKMTENDEQDSLLRRNWEVLSEDLKKAQKEREEFKERTELLEVEVAELHERVEVAQKLRREAADASMHATNAQNKAIAERSDALALVATAERVRDDATQRAEHAEAEATRAKAECAEALVIRDRAVGELDSAKAATAETKVQRDEQNERAKKAEAERDDLDLAKSELQDKHEKLELQFAEMKRSLVLANSTSMRLRQHIEQIEAKNHNAVIYELQGTITKLQYKIDQMERHHEQELAAAHRGDQQDAFTRGQEAGRASLRKETDQEIERIRKECADEVDLHKRTLNAQKSKFDDAVAEAVEAATGDMPAAPPPPSETQLELARVRALHEDSVDNTKKYIIDLEKQVEKLDAWGKECLVQKTRAMNDKEASLAAQDRLRVKLSNMTQSKMIVMDAAQREIHTAMQKLKEVHGKVDSFLEKADGAFDAWQHSVGREVERWGTSIDEFKLLVDQLAQFAINAISGSRGMSETSEQGMLRELNECHRKIKQLLNVVEVAKEREAELANQKMQAVKEATAAQRALHDITQELERSQAETNEAKALQRKSQDALEAKLAEEANLTEFNARHASRAPTSTPIAQSESMIAQPAAAPAPTPVVPEVAADVVPQAAAAPAPTPVMPQAAAAAAPAPTPVVLEVAAAPAPTPVVLEVAAAPAPTPVLLEVAAAPAPTPVVLEVAAAPAPTPVVLEVAAAPAPTPVVPQAVAAPAPTPVMPEVVADVVPQAVAAPAPTPVVPEVVADVVPQAAAAPAPTPVVPEVAAAPAPTPAVPQAAAAPAPTPAVPQAAAAPPPSTAVPQAAAAPAPTPVVPEVAAAPPPPLVEAQAASAPPPTPAVPQAAAAPPPSTAVPQAAAAPAPTPVVPQTAAASPPPPVEAQATTAPPTPIEAQPAAAPAPPPVEAQPSTGVVPQPAAAPVPHVEAQPTAALAPVSIELQAAAAQVHNTTIVTPTTAPPATEPSAVSIAPAPSTTIAPAEVEPDVAAPIPPAAQPTAEPTPEPTSADVQAAAPPATEPSAVSIAPAPSTTIAPAEVEPDVAAPIPPAAQPTAEPTPESFSVPSTPAPLVSVEEHGADTPPPLEANESSLNIVEIFSPGRGPSAHGHLDSIRSRPGTSEQWRRSISTVIQSQSFDTRLGNRARSARVRQGPAGFSTMSPIEKRKAYDG
ncbi:hypothetical protein NFJ02_30g77410 [Pycnococcus provasolii]